MNQMPDLLNCIQQFPPVATNPWKFFYFKTFRSSVLIICLGWIFGSQSIMAQWSANPAVSNAICTATNSQYTPAIVSDGKGGAIITWYDNRNGAGHNNDIYAQHINACGVIQWTADGLAICTAGNSQYIPTIVSDGAGGAIITWSDNRSGSNYDIYAQRVDATGTLRWMAEGVAICTAISDQFSISSVADGSGGAIITWYDNRNGNGDNIYAQRINASGVVQWITDGVAICTATNTQNNPIIVSDRSGGAIITWNDSRHTGGSDIYAQRINAGGLVQWTANGIAISTATNAQYSPAIISNEPGGAIISWNDNRSGNSYDIYAQRINANGVVQWTVDGIVICTAANDQLVPAITSDGSNGAIIIWNDNRSGSNNDIYAQRISVAGALQWTTGGVAICISAKSQFSPRIISDGAGGAIITRDDIRTGSNYDIYAQRINASGELPWSMNGVTISTATNNQYTPAITIDGSNGALIAWHDSRNGIDFDIYAQNVNSNGTIGYISPVITSQPLITQTGLQGTAPTALMVSATGNELNYQWYSNTTSSTTGAINLYPAGTEAVFTPSTVKEGTLYYHCMVTSKCDTLYSGLAKVTVDVLVTGLQIKLSPNPTESFFSMTVNSPGDQTLHVRMFDMLGRLVEYQQGARGQQFKLGEKLAAGMYLIEVRQAGEVIVTKAIKQ